MSYSNTEVLTGILVAACLLLLVCRIRVEKSDGMRSGADVPGLKFRDGYTHAPKHGSYAIRNGMEPSQEPAVKSMHGLETRQTPASAIAKTADFAHTDLGWVPDASIQLDCYTDVGLNDTQFTPNDQAIMEREVLGRQRSHASVNSSAPRSLCGSIMSLTEESVSNNHQSRLLTH
jgi:hypothetical protein